MGDFNFFRIAIKNAHKNRNKIMSTILTFLVIIAIVAGVYSITEVRVNSIEKEIEDMEEYLNSPQVKEKRKLVEEKTKKLGILKNYNTAVLDIDSAIKSQDIIGSSLIETINSTIPQKIFIESITIASQSISISGISEGRVPIAELYNNLSEQGLFYDILIPNITESGEESIYSNFSISCLIKEVTTNEDE